MYFPLLLFLLFNLKFEWREYEKTLRSPSTEEFNGRDKMESNKIGGNVGQRTNQLADHSNIRIVDCRVLRPKDDRFCVYLCARLFDQLVY